MEGAANDMQVANRPKACGGRNSTGFQGHAAESWRPLNDDPERHPWDGYGNSPSSFDRKTDANHQYIDIRAGFRR